MKIWIVSDSEPIPQLTGKGRLMRAGMLAQYAAEMGHEVTWWTSTWLHYEKRFLFKANTTKYLSSNLKICLLHAKRAYNKNISISRMIYYKNLSRELQKQIDVAPIPDIIICSWPAIDLAYVCVKFSQLKRVFVAVDIRDEWPNIFVQPFPFILQQLATMLVHFCYGTQTKYVMREASNVVGVTTGAVNLARNWGRKLIPEDKPYYLSYKRSDMRSIEGFQQQFFDEIGISTSDFIVVYIGTISFRVSQLELVLDGLRMINDKTVKFVICGDGADAKVLKEIAKDETRFKIIGYRNAQEIACICSIAQLGLLPYKNTTDFKDAIPNKVGEYLAYGLPILTTLEGTLRSILTEYQCGYFFSSAEMMAKKVTQLKEGNSLLNNKVNAKAMYHKLFDADVVYKEMIKQMCQLSISIGSRIECSK